MRGSLAIWYERVGDGACGFKPEIELHFNIWKDLPGKADALDAGILLKEPRTISALKMFFPGNFSRSYIEDLSHTMKDGDTLSAVFNELYSVGPEGIGGFDVLNEGGERALHILYVDPSNIDFKSINPNDGCGGTVISIGENILRIPQQQIGNHYIRLRLNLKDNIKDIFGKKSFPSDAPFIPTFSVIDTVEFRVNERRNFSKNLKIDFPEMLYPRIAAVHYFLITNRHTEIIRSHENFRKVRLLEPGLWDRYLDPLGSVKADDLVIYQWREVGGGEKGVDDFIALAAFRKGYDNASRYISTALLVGAVGSTISTFVVTLLTNFFSSRLNALWIDAASFVVLAVLFYGLARWIRWGVEKL